MSPLWRISEDRYEVEVPLTEVDLEELARSADVVQFSSLPDAGSLDRLGELLAVRPGLGVRAYGGYDGSIRDLEFLRRLPGLRRFWADALWGELRSIDGLRHLDREAVEIGLGWTKARLSVRGLERFRSLRRLYLEGRHADLDVVSRLTSLRDLTLRSITLPDLDLLRPLERLRALHLKLGGIRDLTLLPRIGRLEYVELWQIRGLEDVSPLAEVPSLRHLFLQSLRRVTRLPSFSGSPELRRVDLETMKGLHDLAPLAEAPGLEILNLVAFAHARPDILRPLVGHATLRAGIWGFGSNRKNFAAQDLLPLPPEPFGYAAARGREPSPERPPWERPDWTGFRSLR